MSGISIKEQGLTFIFECLKVYQETWLYALLSILCLIIFIRYKKKNALFLFGWYPLILALTVYNPFLMNTVIEKMGFESEYYRFFWLLPVNFLLAYGAVEFISSTRKVWKKAVIAAVFFGSVLICHKESVLDVLDLSLPQNVYKAEDDLLAISEIIHRDSTEEQPTVALPLEYNLQARQYDPSLKLSIERDKMLYWLGSTTVGSYSSENKRYKYQSRIMKVIYGGENIKPKKLKIALRKTKTDYIVVYKAHQVHETVIAAGCTAVGVTENTVVYLTRYGEKHKS